MGQTLSESLLLAVLGGVAGAALAFTAVDAVLRVAPVDLPRLDELRVDGRILIFTTAVSVLAGLLFGLLPAWRSTRTDPLDAMKASARGTTATGAGRLRASLVAVEVGLAVLCLTIGGLLLHSYVSLLGVDAGFDAQQVATVGLNLPDSQYPDVPRRAALIRRVLESVRSLPGVTALGVVNQLPLGGEGGNNLIAPEGSTQPMMERPLADMRNVNRDYFQAMGIPLLSGRLFDEADQDHEIAVISRLTAERLWPGQEAVGKRFRTGSDDTPLVQVAGVVGDVHGISLAEAPRMTAYFPYWQRSRNSMALVIRTPLGPDGIAPAVRAAIHAVDPQLPVPAFRTMREIVSSSIAQQRFQVLLVLLFGATAALLASLGIYGVVSYAVGQRTSELGIRMALGAQPRGLLALVVRQGLTPVAAGAVGGLAAALAAGRLVSRLLYGVRPADPPTIVVVVALVALVGGLAAYLPARRVMRVDPVTALRDE
jgi:predicted permease